MGNNNNGSGKAAKPCPILQIAAVQDNQVQFRQDVLAFTRIDQTSPKVTHHDGLDANVKTKTA
eukprot:4886070-Amphidinium_carterae.1